MKGHVTPGTLVKLLQDDVTARKALMEREHIDGCPSCAAMFQALSQITAPSPGRTIRPDRRVLGKILSFHASYVPPATITVPGPRVRRLRFAAAAACAALGVIFIFGVYSRMQFEHAPIQAAKVKGIVKADRYTLRKGQHLSPGTLITTGEDSKLAIFYGTIMKLVAGPHTSISVTKSHIDRKTGKIHFEMVIDKGTIIAVFDSGRKLQYTLITPHGKVSSTGSKIAMKVNPTKTRVAVKDGAANISSTHGYSVNTEEGSGYSIINNEMTSAFDAPDNDDTDGDTLYNNTLQDLADDDDETVVE